MSPTPSTCLTSDPSLRSKNDGHAAKDGKLYSTNDKEAREQPTIAYFYSGFQHKEEHVLCYDWLNVDIVAMIMVCRYSRGWAGSLHNFSSAT